MRAPNHPEEEVRLLALLAYNVLDTPRESDFDSIAEMAARVCGVPIAAVNFIDRDRQWFKAEVGLGVREMPLDHSICKHAILSDDFVEIPDTTLDPRLENNPLVHTLEGLRFYAGIPLRSAEGLPVGTLCVLDRQPRQLSVEQREILGMLGRQVVTQLEIRKTVLQLQEASEARSRANQELEEKEAFLHKITSQIPVRISYIDRDLRYRFLNGEYERDFGLARGEGEGQRVEDLVGAAAWRVGEEKLHRALAGEALTEEISVPYPFGLRRVKVNFIPDRDDAGVVQGVIVNVQDISDRFQAEERLAGERWQLEQTLESAEIATWRWEIEQDRIYTSQRVKDLFGLTDEEANGGSVAACFRAIHPEDLPTVRASIDSAVETGARYEMECRVTAGRYGERTVLARGSVNLAPNGAKVLSGVLIDVTERRRIDAALRRSKEKYRAIFDSIEEGFCIVEVLFDDAGNPVDMRYDELNPAFERLTGLPAQKLLAGVTIRQLLPNYEQFWIDKYANVVRTGEPMSTLNEVRELDRWYEATAARTGEEGDYRVAIVFNDITVRIRAERERETLLEQLSLERERLHELFQMSPSAIAVLRGPLFRFEYANEAYHHLVGRADIVGKPLLEALPEIEGQPFPDLLRHVLETGETCAIPEAEVRLQQSDGSLRTFYMSFVYQRMRGLDHEEPGIFVHAVDVTDPAIARQRIREVNESLEAIVEERTLELRESIREAEAFNYAISHDLRAPLRAVHATAMILQEEVGDRLDPEHRDLLERQAYNAARLGQLIDELLRLSRLSRAEVRRQPVDLSDKFRRIAADLNPQRTVGIQEGMVVHGDPILLRAVVENLLENAFKFSPDGSIVTVGQSDGVVWIRDEGIGFDMQFAHKLFLPFERLVLEHEFPGTGIGLANVDRIIRRHGGKIWAESQLGRGATFFFHIEPI